VQIANKQLMQEPPPTQAPVSMLVSRGDGGGGWGAGGCLCLWRREVGGFEGAAEGGGGLGLVFRLSGGGDVFARGGALCESLRLTARRFW
jgi:hypothetical protein